MDEYAYHGVFYRSEQKPEEDGDLIGSDGDMLGLARGTLSQVESEARTATEIKLLKQRTYITVSALQEALEQCLLDSVYAMNVFTELYNLAPAGDYDTNIDWKDSILTDTDTELEQKLNLQNARWNQLSFLLLFLY